MKILIIGNSGSGKTYLRNLLEEKGFEKIVTNTTRSKRNEEIDGVDYHFKKNKCDFFKEDLLEYDSFNGNLYGVSRKNIDRAKKDACIVLTPSGLSEVARYLKSKNENYISIYIDSDIETRKKRLKIRDGIVDKCRLKTNFLDFLHHSEIDTILYNSEDNVLLKTQVEKLLKNIKGDKNE